MHVLNSILENARDGKFVTSYCNQCNMNIWPPSDACTRGHSQIVLKEVSLNGTLLANATSYLSKKSHFGLGEFDGIRIIGTFENSIKIGESIRICSVSLLNGKINLKFCSNM